MSSFFTRNQNRSSQYISQHKSYEQKYNTSRMNLLIVVIFTAINLLLLVTNSDYYFLFSAFIPYFIAGTGMLLCGRFPEEFYVDEFEGMVILDNSVFVILLIISIVLTLLYLLAWFMSKKQRVGWLVFALVFFCLDTIGMFVISGISLESAFDILFHAWVIYYLVTGILAHYKHKKLPPEEIDGCFENEAVDVVSKEENSDQDSEKEKNSPIKRVADKDIKHRVLLEAQAFNLDICYRRVKHTNELVINGNVYDEIEGVFEFPHVLKAYIDGHYITAEYNGSYSLIFVDGENVAKKIRLV